MQDEANDDPEQYDCGACPVAAAYRALGTDPVNVRAWELFRTLTTRFVFDAQAVGPVLDRLTAACSLAEYDALLARVATLYDVMYPADEKAGPSGAGS